MMDAFVVTDLRGKIVSAAMAAAMLDFTPEVRAVFLMNFTQNAGDL